MASVPEAGLPPLWPAPHCTSPVQATVDLPGSKSLTNRYLILAALADGCSTLTQPLVSRDTTLMRSAIQALGAIIDDAPDDSSWQITGGPIQANGEVYCGLAGTVMRFVPPLAALADGPVAFDGDDQARDRPLATILDALRGLGIDVDAPHNTLPFTVHGSGSVLGGDLNIDASASSQFVSALLLVAAAFENGLSLRHTGHSLPSAPHLDMTVDVLRSCGVEVATPEPGHWVVSPGPISPFDVVVEPDLSNAGPFVAAAAATGGHVIIPHWPTQTTQAGDALRSLLTEMGSTCEFVTTGCGSTALHVTGADHINGIDVDLHDVGELTPVVAALAALADGPSTLRGIAHLRGHETDRLAALQREITTLGGSVRETSDGLDITPQPLHGGTFHTYHDHRMAHAGAVIGLVTPGVHIDNVATTSKTMPTFPQLWQSLAATGQAVSP